MSFSIEALAMVGIDHNEWGMDFAEWERMDIGPPAPHLYADEFADYQQHHHEEDNEVVKLVKPIDNFDERFGFSVACDHSQDVMMKGIEMAIMMAGINPEKLMVDIEARHDEIRMQERPKMCLETHS